MYNIRLKEIYFFICHKTVQLELKKLHRFLGETVNMKCRQAQEVDGVKKQDIKIIYNFIGNIRD